MTLPPAVNVVRIVFQSSELRCCVAIFPDSVPVNPASGRREVVLQPLPPGPATVVLSGFPGAVAPAPPGVTSVCPTVPVSVAQACVAGATDTPSFTSEPTSLIVEPGGIADVGEVPVQSVPFVIDSSRAPASNSTAASPVSVAFVVADANTALDLDSVRLRLTDAAGETAEVPLDLTPCDDRGLVLCSVDGALEVRGVRAVSAPLLLPVGSTRARVTASNLGDPPRSVDTDWRFRSEATVAPPTFTFTRTSTRTPVPTHTATPSPTVTLTRTATASVTQTLSPTITVTRTERPIPSSTPTITTTRTPTSTLTATPSVTITPSRTITQTRTITGTPTVAPTIPPCAQLSPENPCVPGSSSGRTACDLEWLFSPAPEVPPSGIPRRSISCRDGDAACDTDGERNGRCTFRLALCINNEDPRLGACDPSRLDSFEVRQPNPAGPLDAANAANVAALEGAAGAGGFGVTLLRDGEVVSIGRPNATRNLCSAPFDILVPLGGTGGSTTGVRRLRVRASEKLMVMRLSCTPP